MFEVPPHVRLSEWVTALVLIAASGGAVVRSAGAYPRELYGGLVALVLVVDAVLLWAVLRNDSVRRQRALRSGSLAEHRR